VSAPAQHAREERVRQAPSLSITDRFYAWRDRLLKSQCFQRFSAAFLLTRPIAHRQARALFDLCAGFVYSQILAACVELDLFRRLEDKPKTVDQLARDLDIPSERLMRLLDAAVSLGLLSRRGERRYGLGMLGAALLGNPGIASMVKHHALLYRDLQDPVDLLRDAERSNELAKFWGYAGSSDSASLGSADIAPYSALMASSQSFIADDVLNAYRFGQHKCLMDVGGGEGAFLAAAAKKFPKLDLMLFDLPAVAARAKTCLTSAGISKRVGIHGGSFRDGKLPRGADVISLVRVLHDHDDPVALSLLRAIHQALPPGGKLIIAEPMAGVGGAEHVGSAYFGFYLLAMGTGRARTVQEIGTLLATAGFGAPQMLRTRQPMLVSALAATK
jgi:demethylspheroidene O-methyltransferase